MALFAPASTLHPQPAALTRLCAFAAGLPGLLLALLVLGSGCSSYERLLKSDDFNLKYEKAREYYNKGSYSRALPLFKQLVVVEKGTDREADLMYYIAYSHYGQRDYLMASALFKNYYSFFPRSGRATECHYMSAYCQYLASPKLSLDQTPTYKAIESFQLFVNAHPKSDSVEAANRMIDAMRRKLEAKAVDAADLYYKTRNYRAAAVAYRNLLNDYPDIPRGEYYGFKMIESRLLYAERSLVCKQAERFEEVSTDYQFYTERFPQSPFGSQALSLDQQARSLRGESASACTELERAREFLLAESALRNKQYERAVPMLEAYRKKYPEHETQDQIQLFLVRARLGQGRDAEESCEQQHLLQLALSEYFRFVDTFPQSELLFEAENAYENILILENQAKKSCHEHNPQ
jgi:outer membrane protein assembly factor BamD